MLIAGLDGVSTRMHQMSLAESDTTVQIKRVLCAPGRLSYFFRCGVSKLITSTDNETVVGVF